MTVEEYAAAQAAITTQLVRNVFPTVNDLKGARLSYSLWLQLLRLLFEYVRRARRLSSELGREFYDEQREIHHPDLPRFDQYLDEYKFEWFAEAMEPERAAFSEPGATEDAVAQMVGRMMKETENAGRRQILRSVDEDRPNGARVRWARVATGRETCGWCWMLVSRGPVYHSKSKAGGDEASKFHVLCDCKAVPVFDVNNWPGMEAHKRAEEVWKRVTRGARNNRDAINAFRRAVEAGEIDSRDFAIGTAA